MEKAKPQIGDLVATRDGWSGLKMGNIYGINKSTIQVKVRYSFGTIDCPKQRPEDWRIITQEDEIILNSKQEAIKKAEKDFRETLEKYPQVEI